MKCEKYIDVFYNVKYRGKKESTLEFRDIKGAFIRTKMC
jgi:hypothetical protein